MTDDAKTVVVSDYVMGNNGQGVVYVYTCSSTGNCGGTPSVIIQAPPPQVVSVWRNLNQWHECVAVCGGGGLYPYPPFAMCACPQDDSDYIAFNGGLYFGDTLAISPDGKTLFVGAANYDGDGGVVFVYTRNTDGGYDYKSFIRAPFGNPGPFPYYVNFATSGGLSTAYVKVKGKEVLALSVGASSLGDFGYAFLYSCKKGECTLRAGGSFDGYQDIGVS